MRYFFASYYCSNGVHEGHGDIILNLKSFPSRKAITNAAANDSGYQANQVTVKSLFEFTTKEDFLSFMQGE